MNFPSLLHHIADCTWSEVVLLHRQCPYARDQDLGSSNPSLIKMFIVRILKDFTKEQWTQIWKQISDEDRQQLSYIVERWGSLSDELKQAVLRVVG